MLPIAYPVSIRCHQSVLIKVFLHNVPSAKPSLLLLLRNVSELSLGGHILYAYSNPYRPTLVAVSAKQGCICIIMLHMSAAHLLYLHLLQFQKPFDIIAQLCAGDCKFVDLSIFFKRGYMRLSSNTSICHVFTTRNTLLEVNLNWFR